MKKNFSRKIQKSNSTQTLYQSKNSISMRGSSSTLKVTQTKTKFHEPFYSALHGSQNEEKQYLSKAKKWSEKRALNPPNRRAFHTSCIYNNYLYIFGGKDITEGKLNDIIRLDLTKEKNLSWEKVIPNNDTKLENLAYHSGTLIGDEYYIIGGINAFLRQSPFIFKYNLKENNLKKIKLEKNEDGFGYLSMHTANFFPAKNEIILFGGYSEGKMLNKVYHYNIRTEEIKLQKEQDEENTPEPRIGHGTFIFQNFLYIFGGSIEDGNLLNDLWKLDLNNFTWEKIFENNQTDENKLIIPSQRSGFALSHKEDDNKVYIFGGKIGSFQEGNDLWIYNIEKNEFKIINDTILEQYSPEEIDELLKDKNAKKKNKQEGINSKGSE